VEEPHIEEAGNSNEVDPMQVILARLDQQQRMMEEIRAEQVRQDQERDSTIATAVAAAVASLQQSEKEVVPENDVEPEPQSNHGQIGINRHQGSIGNNNSQESLQTWMERFQKFNPPMFEGTFDTQVAEDWVSQLEKIFKILECPTERKAQMAVYKLEKEADRWWRNTEVILQSRNIPLTWEVFLEQFNEKYFPQSVRDEHEAEFLILRQGEQESFDDYLAKFIRLSRYSTYLKYRNDERWTTEKLTRGLNSTLKEKVFPRQIRRFNEAVEVCRITEKNVQYPEKGEPATSVPLRMTPPGSSKGNSKKRNGPVYESEVNKKQGSRPGSGPREVSRQPRPNVCGNCGRDHGTRPCLAGQGLCYRCGKSGHYARECPQNTTGERYPTQGRVYALTGNEIRKSPAPN